MATISYDRDAPGRSGVSPVRGNGAEKIVTGKFSFDSSYPTGGESISEIADLFRSFLGIWIEDPTDSAGTGKSVVIDYTADAEKALLYDNASPPAQVSNASDQSGAASLRFIAWGV